MRLIPFTNDKDLAEGVSLSPEHQRHLRQQTISEDGPGPILRDFEILLDFIRQTPVKVSGKHNLLPMASLQELNARLTEPLEVRLTRPQQKSYPNINGLYLLLRTTGLALIEGSGSKQFLRLNPLVLDSWGSLNLTERYCTLLEAWLVRGSAEILGEYRDPLGSFGKCAQFMLRLAERSLKIAGDKDAEQSLSFYPELYNLALLHLFGLVRVESGEPEAGKGWRIARIHSVPFGEALLRLVSSILVANDFYWKFTDDPEADFGELQAGCRPFFPEWRNNLRVPKTEFRDGTYIFNVALGKIWRRIAIRGKLTLEDLSNNILQAYKFDNDHLHQFSYKNHFGALMNINHSYMQEPPSTDEVRIGELPLREGMTMTYLFDFGDNWEFEVRLEKIEPADPKLNKPVVLEAHGKAPRQYQDWGW